MGYYHPDDPDYWVDEYEDDYDEDLETGMSQGEYDAQQEERDAEERAALTPFKWRRLIANAELFNSMPNGWLPPAHEYACIQRQAFDVISLSVSLPSLIMVQYFRVPTNLRVDLSDDQKLYFRLVDLVIPRSFSDRDRTFQLKLSLDSDGEAGAVFGGSAYQHLNRFGVNYRVRQLPLPEDHAHADGSNVLNAARLARSVGQGYPSLGTMYLRNVKLLEQVERPLGGRAPWQLSWFETVKGDISQTSLYATIGNDEDGWWAEAILANAVSTFDPIPQPIQEDPEETPNG